MKGKLRILLLLFIVVSLALLIAASYFRYKTRMIDNVSVEKVKVTALGEVSVEGVSYTGTREGRTQWELEAAEAFFSESDKAAMLRGVKLFFFTVEGVDYTLESERGRYDEDTGLIEVSGNVTVVSSEGLRLESDSLNYSASTGEITTDDSVVVDSDGLHVTGTGLRFNLDDRRIIVPKNVRAEFTDAAS